MSRYERLDRQLKTCLEHGLQSATLTIDDFVAVMRLVEIRHAEFGSSDKWCTCPQCEEWQEFDHIKKEAGDE